MLHLPKLNMLIKWIIKLYYYLLLFQEEKHLYLEIMLINYINKEEM